MNDQEPRDIVIEARGITKRYGGVLALDTVNLKVYAGKVNAIVGENGAGKSTLMNILSGACTEYEGDIVLCGKKVAFADTIDARNAGISMIHQELQLVPHLPIAENVFLGREHLTRAGLIDYQHMHEEAARILHGLDFDMDVRLNVSTLRVGQQQLVEIAKALSFDLRVLIMDEPTSALSANETRILFALVKSLTENGVAIVYITHKMDELTAIADYVTVFRDGCSISGSAVHTISVDDLIRLMVGRDIRDFFVKQNHAKGPTKLQIENLYLKEGGHSNRYLLNNISFEVKSAEVLGIFGLMGAGRTELLEIIFGLHPGSSEKVVRIDGNVVSITSPVDAIANGMALIPEDRKCDGLVLGMDIAQNISLASLDRVVKGGLLNDALETTQADAFRDRMTIKSHSSRQTAATLSGGNQQKVVLSKWLVTKPAILLLDEPTRGVDVNAKNDIYRIIDDLASQGIAIVLVSSELPEIMAMADRIIVLSEGRLTGEFGRADYSEERLLKAALPGSHAV
jgi:ribose transport system ATP-binding protein